MDKLYSLNELAQYFALSKAVIFKYIREIPPDDRVNGLAAWNLPSVKQVLVFSDNDIKSILCPFMPHDEFMQCVLSSTATPMKGSKKPEHGMADTPRWTVNDLHKIAQRVEIFRKNSLRPYAKKSPDPADGSVQLHRKKLETNLLNGKYPPSPLWLKRKLGIPLYVSGEVLRRLKLGLHLL
jgi:hypothetical protein